MRLSNLNKFSVLTVSFHFLFFLDLKAEQQIDLWKKDKKIFRIQMKKKNIKKKMKILSLIQTLKL